MLLILAMALLSVGCSENTPGELVAQGKAALEAGNTSGAAIYFKNALEKEPGNIEAKRMLAKSYMQLGKTERAVDTFGELVKAGQAEVDDHLDYLKVLIASQKYDEAVAQGKAFLSFPRETDKQAEALRYIGLAYGYAGDIDAAEDSLYQALEKRPDYVDAHIELGTLASRKGNLKEARKFLTEAIALDEDNVVALELLAVVESSSGNRNEAANLFRRILEVDPSHVEAMYRLAFHSIESRNAEDLERYAGSLKEQYPDAVETMRVNGIQAMLDGRLSEAFPLLSKSQQIAPAIEVSYYLGIIEYQRENLESALSHFRRVVEASPQFIPARMFVTRIFLTQHRVEQALFEAQEMLKDNPGNAYAAMGLGMAHMADRDPKKAMAMFDKAIELQPKLTEAYLRKANLALSMGQPSAAEATIREGLAMDPENFDLREKLFAFLLRQSKTGEAKAVMAEALDGSALDAQVYGLMSLAAMRNSETEEGLALMEKAKGVNPEAPGGYVNKARMLMSLKRYEEAIQELEAVLAKHPDLAEVRYELSALYDMVGKPEQAAAELERATQSANSKLLTKIIRTHLRFERVGKAEAALELLLAKAKDPIQAKVLRGTFKKNTESYAEALALFEDVKDEDLRRGARLKAETLMQMGEYKDAEKEALGLIEAFPDDLGGYLLLSEVHTNAGNLAEAIMTMDKARKLQPRSSLVHALHGQLMLRKKAYKLAEASFEEVIHLEPEKPNGFFFKGVVLEEQGKTEEAIEAYGQALDKDPNYVPALNNLAYQMTQVPGKEKLALVLAMQAYTQDPQNPAVMDSMGYALLLNDRPKDAVRLLEQAAAQIQDEPTVSYHLALAHKAVGNTAAAKEALSKALAQGGFKEFMAAEKLMKQL
jgi:putative PEP-CTERM system TPR-repeat lipoprotein